MKWKDLTKLYGVLLLLHLSSLYVNEQPWLILFSKGSLLFVLGVWWWSESKWRKSWPLYLGLAQLFSWIGDLLLEFQELFLFGLGAFLVAQIAYGWSFRHWLKAEGNLAISHRVYAYLLPSLLMSVLVIPRASQAGDLMIPIILYALVLSMVWALALQLGFHRFHHHWRVLVGATVFLISDSILAYHLFIAPIPHSGYAIMITYGVAQYFYLWAASKQLALR